ncbi:MAG: hypothetical protein KAV87_24385 [Desulfobacteraceae bacterium]|nr:hypothetical protein [Desulfobacteraceae bacterium]
MAKKRSEKQAEVGKLAAPERRREVTLTPRIARAAGEYRSVHCPQCGLAHSLRFWGYTTGFDPDKPFGIIQETGLGKGRSFRVVGHLMPEDEPETFQLVKARLLQAVTEWRDKGWISNEEIKQI